jgi:hypothetical protein
MPLAFPSLSHGTLAFGFFNIESDMLLLDRTFFFAGDFCRGVAALAEAPALRETVWPGTVIDSPEDVGDLMGAIHGVRTTGFIGAVYRRFPFPQRPEEFKQNPQGWKTRALMEELIAPFGRRIEVRAVPEADGAKIAIGGYRFSRAVFHRLLDYVRRGGYPQWRTETPPAEVAAMIAAVRRSPRPLFAGARFEGGPP